MSSTRLNTNLNVLTFVRPDWGMLRRSRRVLVFLYTLRRSALASRTTIANVCYLDFRAFFSCVLYLLFAAYDPT